MFGTEVTQKKHQEPTDLSAQTFSYPRPSGEENPSTDTAQASLPSAPLSAAVPENLGQAEPQATALELTTASIEDTTRDPLQDGGDSLTNSPLEESSGPKEPDAAWGIFLESVTGPTENSQQSAANLVKKIEVGLDGLRSSFEEQVTVLETAVNLRCLNVESRIGALEESFRSGPAATVMQQPAISLQAPNTSSNGAWFSRLASVFAGSAISIGSMLLGLKIGLGFSEAQKSAEPRPVATDPFKAGPYRAEVPARGEPAAGVQTDKKIDRLPDPGLSGPAREEPAAGVQTEKNMNAKGIDDNQKTKTDPEDELSRWIQNIKRRAAESALRRSRVPKGSADAEKVKPGAVGDELAK